MAIAEGRGEGGRRNPVASKASARNIALGLDAVSGAEGTGESPEEPDQTE